MADGGYDPCECIWNHEFAMRRLISILRQSQAYCTDTECLQELPGPPGGQREASDVSGDGFLLMSMCWLVLALALYLLRPSSLRQGSVHQEKPRNGNKPGPDSGHPPPPPAPPTAH